MMEETKEEMDKAILTCTEFDTQTVSTLDINKGYRAQLAAQVAEAKGFELPQNLEGIRSLFMEHPVGDGHLPEAQRAVEEDLRGFLQEERGFSERRVDRALNRLAEAGRLKSSSQPSLFDF